MPPSALFHMHARAHTWASFWRVFGRRRLLLHCWPQHPLGDNATRTPPPPPTTTHSFVKGAREEDGGSERERERERVEREMEGERFIARFAVARNSPLKEV